LNNKKFSARDVSAVFATATWLARWLAGWVSVTRRYCIKTATTYLKTSSTINFNIILVFFSLDL